jgi:hypothetical protein
VRQHHTVTGAILLGEIAETNLEVTCPKCGRQEGYVVADLLAEHGPDMGLPDLRCILTADCSKRESAGFMDRCDAGFARPGKLG